MYIAPQAMEHSTVVHGKFYNSAKVMQQVKFPSAMYSAHFCQELADDTEDPPASSAKGKGKGKSSTVQLVTAEASAPTTRGLTSGQLDLCFALLAPNRISMPEICSSNIESAIATNPTFATLIEALRACVLAQGKKPSRVKSEANCIISGAMRKWIDRKKPAPPSDDDSEFTNSFKCSLLI